MLGRTASGTRGTSAACLPQHLALFDALCADSLSLSSPLSLAQATYVRMKKKAAKEIGFLNVDVQLEETASQEEIEAAVDELNARADVHAILVQLPLPKHVNEAAVLKRILLEKDVDGFSASGYPARAHRSP